MHLAPLFKSLKPLFAELISRGISEEEQKIADTIRIAEKNTIETNEYKSRLEWLSSHTASLLSKCVERLASVIRDLEDQWPPKTELLARLLADAEEYFQLPNHV